MQGTLYNHIFRGTFQLVLVCHQMHLLFLLIKWNLVLQLKNFPPSWMHSFQLLCITRCISYLGRSGVSRRGCASGFTLQKISWRNFAPCDRGGHRGRRGGGGWRPRRRWRTRCGPGRGSRGSGPRCWRSRDPAESPCHPRDLKNSQ